MPGEYSPEELLQALEMQIGVRVKLAHSSPAVGMVVREGQNEWGIVLQQWAKELGGWGVDYEPIDDTMLIQQSADPNRRCIFQGPDIFLQITFPSGRTNCIVKRARTVGELFESKAFLRHEDHRLYVTGIGHTGTIERWIKPPVGPQKDSTDRILESDRIPVLVSSPRRTITLPIEGKVKKLGKHHRIRAYAQPFESVWMLVIEIDTPEGRHTDSGIDLINEVALKSDCTFFDEDGDEIRPNDGCITDNTMSGGGLCEFLFSRKPTQMNITYIPELQRSTIHLPPACLPKDDDLSK